MIADNQPLSPSESICQYFYASNYGGQLMNTFESFSRIKRKLQELSCGAATVCFCFLIFPVSSALAVENYFIHNKSGNQQQKPHAVFKDIWVDYDVVEGGLKGMRIHVKFTTYGMKNLDSYLAVYFETVDGKPLKDKNGKFSSADGQVAVYREMKPGYDPADYNDFTVFMPYDELDLPDGEYALRMHVDIIYRAGGVIQHLTYKDFEFSRKADVEDKDTNSITAEIKRIWVDYNVTRKGRRGMLIHVDFEVSGLKGIDAMLAVRVMNEDDEFLAAKSSTFNNSEGQLELNYPIRPGYDKTVYEDATVFLPYDEIVIGKGVWNLKLDFDLEYDDHEFIQHLDVYEFEFTRR